MVARFDSTDTAMRIEEYLALEESSPIKHEYVDGYVYAMSGGTLGHDAIANNIRAELRAHLRGRSGQCRASGPDVRLRVSPTVYYYPDAIVTCDAAFDPGAVEVRTPRLIVEVLSRSTEADDRGEKFAHYQTLESFEEYLLVDSRRRAVERFRRTGDSLWTYQRYAPDESVTLATIGLTFPLATLYEDSGM